MAKKWFRFVKVDRSMKITHCKVANLSHINVNLFNKTKFHIQNTGKHAVIHINFQGLLVIFKSFQGAYLIQGLAQTPWIRNQVLAELDRLIAGDYQ